MRSTKRKGPALIGLAMLTSCAQATPQTEGSAVTRTTEAPAFQDAVAIAKHAGLTIPPSAIAEYVRYERGMDDSARLILRMPSADWATMQARPPLDALPPRRYDANHALLLGANEGDWKPADEPNIRGAQLSLPNAEALNIGYAPTADGQVRVYVYWHQT